MDFKQLIKQFLPGLAPLIIFVIADSIWGTKIGLIVALIFGAVEFTITRIKTKKTDKFILIDLGLLIVMGAISIGLDNDIFFKLKPVIIGLIICAILGFSAYGPQNLMLLMGQRYMKNISINEAIEQKMRNSIKILFWLFLLHTILTFIAAIWLSKAIWAAISGVGFYVVFAIYVLYELIKNKQNKNKILSNEEMLPVINEKGIITGAVSRSVAHNGSKILHPVVHLHVFNSKGDLFLQKRAANKRIQPNKWDTAVGGHVGINENIMDSLKREAYEEIGIKNFAPTPLRQYIWKTNIEKEFVFVYYTIIDNLKVTPNDEVSEARYWSHEEILDNMYSGVLTENLEHEITFVYETIRKLNLKP